MNGGGYVRKAAGYVRVSKEEQAEKDLSIPAQKERIDAYCRSQDWEIAGYYTDDGYSAKDINRPGLQKLMRDCRERAFDVVVVARLDRLSRSQKDVLYLIEDVFEPGGVGFKSVTQPFDTTSAFGKAAIGMLAVFAQLEREQLIERVCDAKREAARQGRYMGGLPPFGYRHVPGAKRVEIDEVQAAVVKMIYEEFLRGDGGYQAVADTLNERGISAPAAKTWRRSTIRKIIRNPFYGGFIRHDGTLYRGRHPAVVPAESWLEVQARAKKGLKEPPPVPGLVSGRVICGECGAKMRTKNVWQNHPASPKQVTGYYVCVAQERAARAGLKGCRCGYKQMAAIDEEVARQVCGRGVAGDLAAIVGDLLGESGDERAALDQARREMAQLQRRVVRWYDAFERGAVFPGEASERVEALLARRRELEEIIRDGEKKGADPGDGVTVSVEAAVAALGDFSTVWLEATHEERREFIRQMICAVKIYRDGHVETDFFPG